MSKDKKNNPMDQQMSVSTMTFVSPAEFRQQHAEEERPDVRPPQGVGDIIAVASGKGGVGKSTVARALALELVAQGKKVGLVDADVYGPSQAELFNTGDQLQYNAAGTKVLPFERDGVFVISMGALFAPEAHIAWKGPIVTDAILQMFHEVEWPDIDMLIVDSPPGTGDVVLTMLENIPLTGAVVVTTPQQIATLDAARGIRMFHNLNVPVFGIVENMAYLDCPDCGKRHYPFGRNGGQALASRMHIRSLGVLPMLPDINEGGAMSDDYAAAIRDIGKTVLEATEKERHTLNGDGSADDPRAQAGKLGAPDQMWQKLIS